MALDKIRLERNNNELKWDKENDKEMKLNIKTIQRELNSIFTLKINLIIYCKIAMKEQSID